MDETVSINDVGVFEFFMLSLHNHFFGLFVSMATALESLISFSVENVLRRAIKKIHEIQVLSQCEER